VVDPFLDQADLILRMTVHPGFGGQSFIEEVVPKVARVRAELDRREPGAQLEVDGGIDEQTAAAVVRAGASVLVTGSAVFCKHRPWEAVRRICEAWMTALSRRVINGGLERVQPVRRSARFDRAVYPIITPNGGMNLPPLAP